MNRKLTPAFLCVLCVSAVNLQAETIRLPATADIWLSDATPAERDSSMGAAPRLKLKSIQELIALRFDATPIAGRKVTAARLFLKRASDDKLRYLRLSTINQDWSEGKTDRNYGPPDGATWHYADSNTKKPWAWPGSGFCDVIMTSGHSLASYAEKRDHPDNWISVEVSPILIDALAVNDTDGLAVMDGGNLALHNNFFFSREQKNSAPYLELDLAEKLTTIPPAPKATARPAPESAHLNTGAAEITIEPAPDAFCYRITLNGQPLPRWQVPHPRGGTGVPPVKILLNDLTPNQKYKTQITAVSASNRSSPPTALEFTSSAALTPPPKLTQPAPPAAANKTARSILPPLVKTSPDRFQPLNEDLEKSPANSLWDGQTLRLAGARNETLSFQVADPEKPIAAISVADFKGAAPQPTLDWYHLHPARNKSGKLQPAYLIPSAKNDHQSHAYVEIYIPWDPLESTCRHASLSIL